MRRFYAIVQSNEHDKGLLNRIRSQSADLQMIRCEQLPYRDYPSAADREGFYLILGKSVKLETLSRALSCQAFTTATYKELSQSTASKGVFTENLLLAGSSVGGGTTFSMKMPFILIVILSVLIFLNKASRWMLYFMAGSFWSHMLHVIIILTWTTDFILIPAI